MSKSNPVQSYLSYSLATAHRKVHGSLSRRLKEFNVQVEAWRVMEILESGTDMTMGDLAEAVLMNPPTLTKLVDRMVSDGIVHRRMASIDQRQVNLVLTDLGQKRVGQIREQARLEDDEILDKIGVENADLLHRILGELVK
ncbi:MarR family winged helix-turn-helix transcriptional regulator [Sulfitobacter pacificus]|uniref:Transcriptional regulator n=1 Tax=Sulfitobacter pacificus TaxID=1499314 RepID=A0ABQ5VHV2_9RHOB|nr:MarR family winged helix-turn-helix transcriptional regulator [Sulfitobacter pacificus]GLQ26683.1 transcriptional regulator [Sulfitobacter pacificus]